MDIQRIERENRFNEALRKDPSGLNALNYAIRNPFAWPGGYDVLAITVDGGTLCQRCLVSELSTVYRSTRDKVNDGWQVEAVFSSADCDETIYCDHCSEEF